MAKYGKKRIWNFSKTNHFYKQAFERAICDELLEEVLRFYQDQKNSKVLAVFHEDFLKTKNLHSPEGSHLVIVIMFNNLLVTAFWCKDLKGYLKKSGKKNAAVVLFPENKKITKHTKL